MLPVHLIKIGRINAGGIPTYRLILLRLKLNAKYINSQKNTKNNIFYIFPLPHITLFIDR